MAMFIKGLGYVKPCESRFSRQSIDDIVDEQFTQLCTTIKNCLEDHAEIASKPEYKEAFPALKEMLYQLQSEKLPYKLARRARREHALVKSIQRHLYKRLDIICRATDKSNVFYEGNAIDFARKATEYMFKTEAYRELPSDHCPLADNLNSVRNLLHDLLKKKAINQDQHKMMAPKMNTLELAHLHFIPKPHKVILIEYNLTMFF